MNLPRLETKNTASIAPNTTSTTSASSFFEQMRQRYTASSSVTVSIDTVIARP